MTITNIEFTERQFKFLQDVLGDYYHQVSMRGIKDYSNPMIDELLKMRKGGYKKIKALKK